MSLSTDVLSRAIPTRLTCRGGRWVLELTRLEAVDRDVFQPRLTRLEGSESILAALRRSEEGQHLASAAAQLMRGPRGDEDRVFEVNEGDWVPSADSGLPTREQRAEEGHGSETTLLIAEMRAELAVLRASHARLRDRVIALEAAQSGLGQNTRPLRGSRSQRRRSEPPPGFAAAEVDAEPLAVNPGFAATQASPALVAAASSPAPAGAAVAAAPAGPSAARVAPAPSFEELAKAMAGEQPPPLLSLPSLQSLSECLASLMGSPVALARTEECAFDALVGLRACKLLDDEGRERGAIVLDVKAAVSLGAALLALPEAEALRQGSVNEPSEDALLAMSEICNNLTGPVNAVTGNAHVRSTALSSVDVGELPKPRARLDLAYGGGHLVLAMF